MSEIVVDDVERSVETTLRVAMQIGEALAATRRQNLERAARESAQRAAAMNAQIQTDLRLARPVLEQATSKQFWNAATPKDAAAVYELAKRFEHIDGAAAVTARTVEREAKERWNVDLTQPVKDPAHQAEIDKRTGSALEDELAEAEERLERINDRFLEHAARGMGRVSQAEHDQTVRLADAAEQRVKELRAAVEVEQQRKLAQTAQTAENSAAAALHTSDDPAQAQQELERLEQRSSAEWDTLVARENWARDLETQVNDPNATQAVRARVTADKGLSKPPHKAVTETKPVTKAKKPKKAVAGQARKLTQ